LEVGYQDVELRNDTPVADTMAVSDEHEVAWLYTREISDNTTAICLSPEIAENVDRNPVNNGSNKCSCPFVFDFFAENDDGLSGPCKRPAKRRFRDLASLTGIGEV
jgi:hypothetical protein